MPAVSPRLPRKHRWWMKGAHTKEHKPVAAAGDRDQRFIQVCVVQLSHRRRCSLQHLPPIVFVPGLPSPLCPVFPGLDSRQCAAVRGTPTSAWLSSAAAVRTKLQRGWWGAGWSREPAAVLLQPRSLHTRRGSHSRQQLALSMEEDEDGAGMLSFDGARQVCGTGRKNPHILLLCASFTLNVQLQQIN